jgi:hypothetical protein
MIKFFIFQLNTWGNSPSITLSDVRMGLSFTITAGPRQQSFSGLIPAELMTIFCCLRCEARPTWRAMSPYLYPPGKGWPGYTLRPWVPFSSPPVTHMAMVEVFDPTSTWVNFLSDSLNLFKYLRPDNVEGR